MNFDAEDSDFRGAWLKNNSGAFNQFEMPDGFIVARRIMEVPMYPCLVLFWGKVNMKTYFQLLDFTSAFAAA